jgi:hypothetical protein
VDTTNFHWASVVHNPGTDACVLGIPAPAKNRPILLEDAQGVAMVSVNDRANASSCASGRGKDFTPGGAVLRAARSHIDLAWKYLVQRFSHEAERILLPTPGVDNLDGHSTPNQAHAFLNRLNRLGQELVRKPQDIQYIADYRRVKIFGDCAKQLNFARSLHSRMSLGARAYYKSLVEAVSTQASQLSRREFLTAVLALPIGKGLSFDAWRAAEAVNPYAGKHIRPASEHIQAFCVDFNWTAHGIFAPPGQWADADPGAHVAWYHAAGVNTIQTFCVSCNGYAWYKGGQIPAQPGLKHNFLSDVCRQGHDRGQRVMGYFCIGANSRWQKLHPEESYGVDSHSPNIVFTGRYLDYLDAAIAEALHATSIDGFMIDWLWTPAGSCTWLSCEQAMYEEFFGKPFPGKATITAEEELEFKRRSIDRCWSRIHSAAKRQNPQAVVWLTCNNPSDPTITASKTFAQVDWLMNENPDPSTWQGAGKIGTRTKLIQCVVGWGAKDDAPSILQHPVLNIKDFYGFSMPGENSLPLPVDAYLQKPIDSFQGNDRNIAALVRYFNGMPFDFIKLHSQGPTGRSGVTP